MYNHDLAGKLRHGTLRPERFAAFPTDPVHLCLPATSATQNPSKTLNVDSPSFTPSTPNGTPAAPSLSKKAFSPKAVGGVVAFVPRSKPGQ